jgi:6-pyruvoyltetrahydropterin/6-carboxytetrahydropterin synthase
MTQAGTITATRYHDFSCGHRVFGHESKCAYLHGHNYRVHFTIEAKKLDNVGRVLDFSAIKECLCEWLENAWDHRFLLWEEDPVKDLLFGCKEKIIKDSVVIMPFNPTAENMARFLLESVGPAMLPDGIKLTRVVVEETRKCSATAEV